MPIIGADISAAFFDSSSLFASFCAISVLAATSASEGGAVIFPVILISPYLKNNTVSVSKFDTASSSPTKAVAVIALFSYIISLCPKLLFTIPSILSYLIIGTSHLQDGEKYIALVVIKSPFLLFEPTLRLIYNKTFSLGVSSPEASQISAYVEILSFLSLSCKVSNKTKSSLNGLTIRFSSINVCITAVYPLDRLLSIVAEM